MDLPTYTSIWRIEKRLYKLYDFRLPMPVPVGQIAVFAAITVPYVVLLTILGLPFNHTLFWLYVLPPGVLTWLATRPVLESKRLPELIISQVRYLGEPATWCRMTALTEKDDVVVVGRIWRQAQASGQPEDGPPGSGQIAASRKAAGPPTGNPHAPGASAWRRRRRCGPPGPRPRPTWRRRPAGPLRACGPAPGHRPNSGPGPGSSRSHMTAGRSTQPRLVACRMSPQPRLTRRSGPQRPYGSTRRLVRLLASWHQPGPGWPRSPGRPGRPGRPSAGPPQVGSASHSSRAGPGRRPGRPGCGRSVGRPSAAPRASGAVPAATYPLGPSPAGPRPVTHPLRGTAPPRGRAAPPLRRQLPAAPVSAPVPGRRERRPAGHGCAERAAGHPAGPRRGAVRLRPAPPPVTAADRAAGHPAGRGRAVRGAAGSASPPVTAPPSAPPVTLPAAGVPSVAPAASAAAAGRRRPRHLPVTPSWSSPAAQAAGRHGRSSACSAGRAITVAEAGANTSGSSRAATAQDGRIWPNATGRGSLLPIGGPRVVVVLGCTVGAGQTVTTLMIADLLASLRGERSRRWT